MKRIRFTLFILVTLAVSCIKVSSAISVTDVVLDPKTLTMAEGDCMTLIATISPSNATNRNLRWSSSDEMVASVADGKVTAHKAGKAVIVVSTEDGGLTANCQVTVNSKAVRVESVSLDRKDLALMVGESATLTATVFPSNATDKNVRWTSTNTSVVSAVDGKVTALKVGSATVTVTTQDGGRTASCRVTVKSKVVSVESVRLDKKDLTLTVGKSEVLTAMVSPSNATNRNVRWSSSDETVASAVNGRVMAFKPGSTTVTVTTEDGGLTASCQVTVKSNVVNVENVSLSKTELTLTEGEIVTLTAVVSPSNATNKNVRWVSSNAAVASVEGGKVTALKVGSATITVTTEDGGKTANCQVSVNPKIVNVESVSLDRTELTLTEGESTTLTAVVFPSNATDRNVRWSSSDATVASVVNGKVTALKAGSAIVTVTTEDGGRTASCRVTVKSKVVNVESVSLNKSSVALIAGESVTLVVTVSPSNATNKNVSWHSSDESVATVSNGRVTALKAGSAVITVTAEDGGKTAICQVSVKPKIVNVQSVSLNKSSITLTEGESITLTAVVSPSNATNKNVRWSSSDASVASVVNGKVTALKAGSSTIKVTTEDGGLTASCQVVVKSKEIRVKSVSLNRETLALEPREKATLTATVFPSNATNKNVWWSSSDATIVSVDNGRLYASKLGRTTITVTTEDGRHKASCQVVVENIGEGSHEGIGEKEW